MARITSVRFKNFKGLKQCSVSLEEMNILVGPNNAGKSTVLSAFRLLEAGLRVAGSRKPEMLTIEGQRCWGYRVNPHLLDISVENIHTDYIEDECFARFRLSNRNHLTLRFTRERDCFLVGEVESGGRPRSVKAFRKYFPISVTTVPVLGPVEHGEDLRQERTVRNNLQTHRAARNFRSYWWYNKDRFPAFRELIEQTWPGMSVEAPRLDHASNSLSMFVTERRIPRELYWSGFGFQVWCQLLTHIERGRGGSILIIDEPEIYLHPEVQRQLYGLLSSFDADVLVATHSAELIAEAEAGEILVLDKRARSAKRLRSTTDVQKAFDLIGSGRNLALTQLARTRRLLFVEGEDFKLIGRMARALGYDELAEGRGLTIIPIGGFGAWKSLPDYVQGIEAALGQSILAAAVFDSDYRCTAHNDEVRADLEAALRLVFFHECKEVENYLLEPAALEKALERAVRERRSRGGRVDEVPDVRAVLREVVDQHHRGVRSGRVGEYQKHFQTSGKDPSTLADEALEAFERRWPDDPHGLVPGKQVFSEVVKKVREASGVTLTHFRVADALSTADSRPGLISLLGALDGFRRIPPP